MTSTISEKTTISLFATIASVPFLAGGIYWLTVIYEQGAEAARINARQDNQIEQQAETIEKIKDMVVDIRERTIRIEERLKRQAR